MSQSTIIKPPKQLPLSDNRLKIFLAGTIDMGYSEDWQSNIEKELSEENIIIFNPRRDFWNQNWKDDITDPNFNEQVNWELDALEKSDIIIFYFAPNSKSPISLLEFGLFVKESKYILICDEGYYKKGNLDIVCKRNNIQKYKSLNDIIVNVKKIIREENANV